ncbi:MULTISPECIES: MerC domain-containing protein [Sphingobium]|uniref:MerC domain-containing protein n=1 Tax=Sphingobium lignivorans TaxID=2735886 RepID=A0ABR6NC05_9SPHN|nr:MULTISPECIES: MerC domain-containing protein [Sphingobium]MBB5984811.1 hypothetical protein [Sphingobium lignivorans]BAK65486.1 hypothetical protein SLG_08110 [Sphingobium sp. SYK-6]
MALNRTSTGSSRAGINVIESAAISGSLICLLHCLALPALLLLLPGTMLLFAQSEAFHVVALALLAPSAGLAFWLGYRRHGSGHVALAGGVGLLLLALALLPDVGEGGELWLTVTGSVLLIAGHVANWRLRR